MYIWLSPASLRLTYGLWSGREDTAAEGKGSLRPHPEAVVGQPEQAHGGRGEGAPGPGHTQGRGTDTT